MREFIIYLAVSGEVGRLEHDLSIFSDSDFEQDDESKIALWATSGKEHKRDEVSVVVVAVVVVVVVIGGGGGGDETVVVVDDKVSEGIVFVIMLVTGGDVDNNIDAEVVMDRGGRLERT